MNINTRTFDPATGLTNIRLIFLLKMGALTFLFQAKLMNLWQLLCTITCMDHFVICDIGEPSSMNHSVTVM